MSDIVNTILTVLSSATLGAAVAAIYRSWRSGASKDREIDANAAQGRLATVLEREKAKDDYTLKLLESFEHRDAQRAAEMADLRQRAQSDASTFAMQLAEVERINTARTRDNHRLIATIRALILAHAKSAAAWDRAVNAAEKLISEIEKEMT